MLPVGAGAGVLHDHLRSLRQPVLPLASLVVCASGATAPPSWPRPGHSFPRDRHLRHRAAEDAAQEAFLRAHRDWDRIGRYDHPGAWVRRVVANLVASAFRRRLAEARALVRLAGRREPTQAADPAGVDF